MREPCPYAQRGKEGGKETDDRRREIARGREGWVVRNLPSRRRSVESSKTRSIYTSCLFPTAPCSAFRESTAVGGKKKREGYDDQVGRRNSNSTIDVVYTAPRSVPRIEVKSSGSNFRARATGVSSMVELSPRKARKGGSASRRQTKHDVALKKGSMGDALSGLPCNWFVYFFFFFGLWLL